MAELGPIRKSVSVARAADEAFKVFTEGIGSWWPAIGHSIGDERVANVVFEAKAGGRVYEVWDDGTEHDWAVVTECDPPNRFVLSWKPNPARPAPTEIEVTFSAEGAGTRLDLEHRGWELLGDDAPQVREQYSSGWPVTLGRFADAAA